MEIFMNNWKAFIKQYKYIIFDFDGTMVDSMWMWRQLDIEMLGARGFVMNQEASLRLKTLGLMEGAAFIADYFALPDSVDALSLEIIHRAREKYAREIPVKPGVLELLAQLKQEGVSMCIATASDRINVEAVCRKYGILDDFSFMLTSDEINVGKRQPDIFLACQERFGAAAEEILVVEDSLHAAGTARKAGFPVLGVYDAYSAKEWDILKEVSNAWCESFAE
jgi:HAD superfamily hydrolase (TIGR01509 family)